MEDQEIDEKSNIHTVTPQNDPHQKTYTCHGIHTERPFYSRKSDHFKTKNLREYKQSLEGLCFKSANFSLSHCFLIVFYSFEEEGPFGHFWLSPFWPHFRLPWMHCPQSLPQTRYYLNFGCFEFMRGLNVGLNISSIKASIINNALITMYQVIQCDNTAACRDESSYNYFFHLDGFLKVCGFSSP